MFGSQNELFQVSTGTRFLNFLIDQVCYFLLMVPIFFALGFALGAAGVDLDNPGADLLIRLLGIVSYFIYYFVFEGAFQRTPGKFITGTIVVNETGGKRSIMAIAGRTLSRLIPFEAIVGLIRGEFWHDTLPGTKVVHVS